MKRKSVLILLVHVAVSNAGWNEMARTPPLVSNVLKSLYHSARIEYETCLQECN